MIAYTMRFWFFGLLSFLSFLTTAQITQQVKIPSGYAQFSLGINGDLFLISQDTGFTIHKYDNEMQFLWSSSFSMDPLESFTSGFVFELSNGEIGSVIGTEISDILCWGGYRGSFEYWRFDSIGQHLFDTTIGGCDSFPIHYLHTILHAIKYDSSSIVMAYYDSHGSHQGDDHDGHLAWVNTSTGIFDALHTFLPAYWDTHPSYAFLQKKEKDLTISYTRHTDHGFGAYEEAFQKIYRDKSQIDFFAYPPEQGASTRSFQVGSNRVVSTGHFNDSSIYSAPHDPNFKVIFYDHSSGQSYQKNYFSTGASRHLFQNQSKELLILGKENGSWKLLKTDSIGNLIHPFTIFPDTLGVLRDAFLLNDSTLLMGFQDQNRFYLIKTINPNFLPSSIAEFQKSIVEIYPNPASDRINISGPWSAFPSFSIQDGFGREIKVGYSQEGEDLVLYASELSPGLYILRISDGKSQYTEKVLID